MPGSEDLRLVVVPRELYYHEKEYVRGLENLARAVLLFHRGGPADWEAWEKLTGDNECTIKALCDFARKVTREP